MRWMLLGDTPITQKCILIILEPKHKAIRCTMKKSMAQSKKRVANLESGRAPRLREKLGGINKIQIKA